MYRAICKVAALKKLEFQTCKNVKFPVNPGLSKGGKEYWTGNYTFTLTL